MAGDLALGLKLPGDAPCTLMVGIVGSKLLFDCVLAALTEKNEFVAAGLFGDGCKVMLCSFALRLLLNDDSRLACRLAFAVYSCNDSMPHIKLRSMLLAGV